MENRKTASPISEYHLNRHRPDRPQFAVHDLGDYLAEHREKAARPHIHSFYQLIWFRQGGGRHVVDFQEHNVADNAVFFIAKNQVHCFDSGTAYRGVLLHFNEAFLVGQENEMGFFLKRSLFGNPYEPPFCAVGRETERLLGDYVSQIKREFENGDAFGREELLRSYLKAFLIQAQRAKNEARETDGGTPFAPGEKRAQLVRFINLIDENYAKGLSVSEYAGQMAVSPRTLSDLTQLLLRKTPSQMVQERTVLEAQRLLVHSGLNVGQIGYRLGFDDPSYFVKYFKKHAGVSPSAFRKSVS